MIARLVEFALVQRILICVFGVLLLFGGLYAFHILDVVAYPDPSPPMVEVITQFPGWSAEEIERQITARIEQAIGSLPRGYQLPYVYFDSRTYEVAVYPPPPIDNSPFGWADYRPEFSPWLSSLYPRV
jgi:hypothetical protein